MPVEVGSGAGQYNSIIEHVGNGEYGNQDVFRRPSINLENRTEALKVFAENEEARLNAVSNKADSNELRIQALEDDPTPEDYIAHAADNSRHTVYASDVEVKAGSETQKVISPATYGTANQEWIGRMYDAIVGDTAIAGNTHATLQDAIVASSSGWKILVTQSESIDSTINVTLDNIEIEFRRGASFFLGAAATAINISGNDCYISKGRFVGFTTAAINITAAANRTTLRDTRYNGNTTDVQDAGVATHRLGEIME
jgi:hypothetical protein